MSHSILDNPLSPALFLYIPFRCIMRQKNVLCSSCSRTYFHFVVFAILCARGMQQIQTYKTSWCILCRIYWIFMKSIKHETDIAATKQMRYIFMYYALYTMCSRAQFICTDVPVFAINSRSFCICSQKMQCKLYPPTQRRVQCTTYAGSQRRCTGAVAVSWWWLRKIMFIVRARPMTRDIIQRKRGDSEGRWGGGGELHKYT